MYKNGPNWMINYWYKISMLQVREVLQQEILEWIEISKVKHLKITFKVTKIINLSLLSKRKKVRKIVSLNLFNI